MRIRVNGQQQRHAQLVVAALVLLLLVAEHAQPESALCEALML